MQNFLVRELLLNKLFYLYKDNFLAIAILSCFSLIFQVPRTPRSFAASRSCPHRVLLYPITKEDPPDLNFLVYGRRGISDKTALWRP